MNIEGLCRVLTKYLGVEVVVGPKRGAKMQHERPPVPDGDTQFKATLAIQNVDSQGKPHLRREYNQSTQKLKETVTTENTAIVGLRLEAFKGADYSWDTLSKLRVKMALPAFHQDLRREGFALNDTGVVRKISNQVADTSFMEFGITWAEVLISDPEQGWIESMHGTATASGTQNTPSHTVVVNIKAP